ncbi:hypothetical protein FHW16_002686 [Phyllobacterium myrsinacearum]|uniref:Uncharacterized protein n=1 Tax=Phyllobacterium myrsinacearum TaxID=28101 RepID=A0A839EKZ3_9HYPH|nr:hypothetical protein [Phyllobacterium myrsinacearum]
MSFIAAFSRYERHLGFERRGTGTHPPSAGKGHEAILTGSDKTEPRARFGSKFTQAQAVGRRHDCNKNGVTASPGIGDAIDRKRDVRFVASKVTLKL